MNKTLQYFTEGEIRNAAKTVLLLLHHAIAIIGLLLYLLIMSDNYCLSNKSHDPQMADDSLTNRDASTQSIHSQAESNALVLTSINLEG
jgi:NRPS condensation-like uncharacterized protein